LFLDFATRISRSDGLGCPILESVFEIGTDQTGFADTTVANKDDFDGRSIIARDSLRCHKKTMVEFLSGYMAGKSSYRRRSKSLKSGGRERFALIPVLMLALALWFPGSEWSWQRRFLAIAGPNIV
jgi:hypothetical protein